MSAFYYRTGGRVALVLAVVLGLTAMTGIASAKAPPHKSAEAKKHYDAGFQHYKAQAYEQAITEWEAGYELAPDSQYLFNLGQACRAAKQPDRALDYYKKYLAEVPDAENRPKVEERIAELEKAIAAEKARDQANAEPAPAPVAVVAPVEEKLPPGGGKVHSADEPSTPYQLGVRVRGLFVTQAMLSPFLKASTSMESFSVGIEFIYRKPKYDIVTSLDYSSLDVKDGNYLSVNHPPDLDSHYVQFRGLSFISADVSLIGHNDLTRWLEIRYGGGLGIGAVLGDVLLTNNSQACTLENASDIAACHPQNVDLTSPQKEAQLKATETGAKDVAQDPHRHVSKDVPPVMGVVNLLVGFRFKLPKKVTAQVEVGFRDAIFAGVGVHYLF